MGKKGLDPPAKAATNAYARTNADGDDNESRPGTRLHTAGWWPA